MLTRRAKAYSGSVQ